jgi:hypothetical protein
MKYFLPEYPDGNIKESEKVGGRSGYAGKDNIQEQVADSSRERVVGNWADTGSKQGQVVGNWADTGNDRGQVVGNWAWKLHSRLGG